MSTITLACPECQSTLRFPDTLRPGQKVRCPRCQAVFPAFPAEDRSAQVVPAKERPRGYAPRDDHAARDAYHHLPVRAQGPGGEEDGDDSSVARSVVRRRGALVWWLVAGGVLVLAGGAVALYFLWPKGPKTKEQTKTQGKKKEAPPPGWAPDPALVGQLALEEILPGFRLRPPGGYTLNHLFGTGAYLWKSPRQPDGSAHSFLVMIHPLDSGSKVPLKRRGKKYLANFLKEYKSFFPDIAATPLESGTIDGVEFVRTKLTGTSRKKGKMRGFCYLAVVDKNLVTFTSLASGPNPQGSLKTAETAVLTFKKK
jgi:hypothetical protein